MISFITEFVQCRKEQLFPPAKNPLFEHRGGATVVFDHRGVARYVIDKSINNRNRLARSREYLVSSGSEAALRFTEPGSAGALFRTLHGGY